MGRPQTALSGLAAVALAILAVAELGMVISGHVETEYLRLPILTAGLLGVVVAARLWSTNCFECRLVAFGLGLVTLVGAVLKIAFGLPGVSTSPTGVSDVLLVVVGAAVPALLFWDRARQWHGLERPGSYRV